MTAHVDGPLHPQLQKLSAVHRRRLRLLGLVVFLSLAGFVMIEMAIAFSRPSAGSILWIALVGMLMLPVVVSVGGLMWYLDHALSRSLQAASDLLRDCVPHAVRLRPIESAGRGGVLATLHPVDAGVAPEPYQALINPAYRWGPAPTGEQLVQLYTRQAQHGNGFIALQPDGMPLLGKWVDRSRYERQRWIVRTLALLLLLGILAMLGLPMLGKAGA